MGQGAAKGLASAAAAASQEDIKAAMSGIPEADRSRLMAAFNEVNTLKKMEKYKVNPMKLGADMPMGHDLTLNSEHDQYMAAANTFYDHLTMEELQEVETVISATTKDTTKYPVGLHIALKNAISKKLMDGLPAIHCTCVFALYHENNRMVAKGEDKPGKSHPNGEDFVRRKHRQLSWLFDKRKADCSFSLLGADDGCDRDSAGLMATIAKEEGFTNVSVHKLNDAVKAKSCPVLDYTKLQDSTWDANDLLVKASQKGGAIIFGLYQAGQEKVDAGKKHIIVYTDSDLSTDLALCGLNFKTICDGADVSVSQRFGQPNAVNCSNKLSTGGVAPGLARDSIVHLTLRHKLRMNLLPPLSVIIDTNCGHKAITAEASMPILKNVQDYKGSFDMDWLMCAGNAGKARGNSNPIGVTAIPWVASVAESNFWGGGGGDEDPAAAKLKSMTSWFKIFSTMCTMHEWHKAGLESTGQLTDDAKAYKEWVEKLTVQEYMKLVDNILAKLGDKELVMPEPLIMGYDLESLKKLAA